MLTLIQNAILGAVQGITEWLPISSSGATTLILTNFFNVTSTTDLIETTLFLHLGTFLAALIYFRRDVTKLLVELFQFAKSKISRDHRPPTTDHRILSFLIISTLITGILGFIILTLLESLPLTNLTGKTITFAIATLLLVTGLLQLNVKSSKGIKTHKQLKHSDGVIAGITQGLSTLPGLSRSGTTVSTLLLLKFDETLALHLSFLMSLPVVLGANIILNLDKFAFSSTALAGLATSFIFGITTIHALIRLSKKINFAWFVLGFSILTYLSLLFI